MHKNLIALFQIIILCQVTFSKEITQYDNALTTNKEFQENSLIKCLLVTDLNLEPRSITEIWNNIKQTAINIFNSLKKLAEDTQVKIKSWIEHVKNEGRRIQQTIERRIQELKTRVIAIIHKIFGEGEIMKKCLQKQNENIDKALKEILSGVTTCISGKINSLEELENYSDIVLNDTELVLKIEAKFKKCMEKEENIDECVQDIRKEITDENNNMEEVILKQRAESRNTADDILDAIVKCSTEGFIEAVEVISAITLEIITCILEDK